MKLTDLYLNKLCPRQPRYKCEGSNCAKFISCMIEEIDALHVIGRNNDGETDALDRELIKAVAKCDDESLL